MTASGNRSVVHAMPEGVGRENDIYTRRFDEREEATRNATWKVLCEDFLQQYIHSDSVVIDIGAGDGLFFKHIHARKKIAVDLSPHVQELGKIGVEIVQLPASNFSRQISEPGDVIFMSNFLEHLPSKHTVLEILSECRRALKPGGIVMILQPNIRYVGSAYWDYIDHHIALTEHSLSEALEVSGYSIVRMIPRFLPYTAKSGIGHLVSGHRTEMIVRNYLRFPLLWKIFGQQTFVVAAPRIQK